MVLNDATIVQEKKYSDYKQIFISAAKGEKDMLVECDSMIEMKDWMDAIDQHIAYATKAGLTDSLSMASLSMFENSKSMIAGDRVSSSDATAT
jgi:hypothetical protein